MITSDNDDNVIGAADDDDDDNTNVEYDDTISKRCVPLNLHQEGKLPVDEDKTPGRLVAY
jgi:hypothetical protein